MTQESTFSPVVIHCDNEQDWLQQRKNSIGASEISTVCGFNPYQTPLQLWAVKCDLVEPEDLSENEAVEWGWRLEDVIAQKFYEETGRMAVDSGRYEIYRHPEHEFCTCTPDRFTVSANGEKAVLEIKTAGAHMAEHWEEEPPGYYRVQVQWQMFCTGLQHGVIACLIGGRKFVWAEIDRDDSLIEHLFSQSKLFWEMVQNRTQPPAEYADTEMLKNLFPKPEYSRVNLDGEALTLDEEIESAKTEIKKWDNIKRSAENRLKQLIGKNEIGVLPNGVSYSWKLQHRDEYMVKANSFRVLRRKGTK